LKQSLTKVPLSFQLEYERHRRKELDKVKMAEDVVQKKEREELLKRLETYKKKTEDLYGELRKLQTNMERHRGEVGGPRSGDNCCTVQARLN
jgi:anion-transporting  ArsA/GET3 family ATPase